MGETYAVTIWFNSRLKGGGQRHDTTIVACDHIVAIEKATADAVRLPGHGQAIFVTGVQAMQRATALQPTPDSDGEG